MLELAPSILMSVISVLPQKYAYILAFSSSKDKGLNRLEASLRPVSEKVRLSLSSIHIKYMMH